MKNISDDYTAAANLGAWTERVTRPLRTTNYSLRYNYHFNLKFKNLCHNTIRFIEDGMQNNSQLWSAKVAEEWLVLHVPKSRAHLQMPFVRDRQLRRPLVHSKPSIIGKDEMHGIELTCAPPIAANKITIQKSQCSYMEDLFS